MDKLLHERLRGIESHEDDLYLGGTRITLYRREAQALADEIERFYIPRPRFEDGEPVQGSDLKEIGALATCCVYTDGSWEFDPDKFEDERNPKPWDEQQGRQCDRIKRPSKVLDADGVPIKVGETLYWNLDTCDPGCRYVVKKIEPMPQGNACKVYRDEVNWMWSDKLTHKEPDTLLKVRDSLGSHYDEGEYGKIPEDINRLTALIERGA